MKPLQAFLTVTAAIFAAGMFLDEAAQGTFGSHVKTAAHKITRGFGI